MDPSHHLCGRQLALGLHDRFLAMDPVWLNAVEPRTLGRQLAEYEADPTCAFGLCIVGTYLLSHFPAEMSRGIIPDHQQCALALSVQLPATPVQELSGEGGDRTPHREAQPDFFSIRP